MYLFYCDIFIHLDYFQFYANMNTAAQNIYISVFWWTCGYIPVEYLGVEFMVKKEIGLQ